MENENYSLGKLQGIEINVVLTASDIKQEVCLDDLPKEIKDEVYKIAKEKGKNRLDNWMQNNSVFFIEKEQYYRLINLNDSILKNRSIDNKTYLNYLLQAKNEKEIIGILKSFDIKYYSSYKKKMEKIEYLINQLTDDECFEYIEESEIDIISLEFANALQIINGKSRDKLNKIKVINEEENEIELNFSNFHNFETVSSLIINHNTIGDPERLCDCIIGRDGGFCSHFFVGFIYSYKKGFFNLSDWRLTKLPSSFETMIKGLKI